MIQRNLHETAERLLRKSGQTDASGYLTSPIVQIDTVAEEHLGLTIVGAERSGVYRLPPRKLGSINLAKKTVVIRKPLFEDEGQEALYRQVLAHEAAHALIHGHLGAQLSLPFGGRQPEVSHLWRLEFSRDQSVEHELEANVLGALLLVPSKEMQLCLEPTVRTYVFGDWSRMSACVDEAESRAASLYSRNAIQTLMRRFEVTEGIAKLALGYWDSLHRPSVELRALALGSRGAQG